MRRLLFPAFVLLVAAVLWWLEPPQADRRPAQEAGGPGSAEAEELRPAPPAAIRGDGDSSARLSMSPPILAEEGEPEAIGGVEGGVLTLRFLLPDRADADDWRCQLRPGGDWEHPDPAPLRLGEARTVRARLLPGEVVVLLRAGAEEAAVDRFVMPDGDLERELRLPFVAARSGRVEAAGQPVAGEVALLSLEPDGTERELSRVTAGEDGRWRAELLLAEPAVARVSPSTPGFRQPFGPFPLLPAGEITLSLPSGALQLAVDPALGLGGAGLVRMPLAEEAEPWPPERMPARAGALADGLDRVAIGPCRLLVVPEEDPEGGRLWAGTGPHTLRAGERLDLRLEPVPAGRVRLAFDGGAARVLAGVEWNPLDEDQPGVARRPLLAEEARPGEHREAFLVSAGRWELRVRGPVLVEGSQPPRYLPRPRPGEIWSTELVVEPGAELLLHASAAGEEGLWRVERLR
jgi:hypothetical protein